MPRAIASKAESLFGPTKLSKILQNIRAQPRPVLHNVHSLHLTYAAANNHFGARKFVRNELVRIAYHNPTIKASVEPIRRLEHAWLTVRFQNESEVKVPIHNKTGPAILHDVIEIAGSRRRPPSPQEAQAETMKFVERGKAGKRFDMERKRIAAKLLRYQRQREKRLHPKLSARERQKLRIEQEKVQRAANKKRREAKTLAIQEARKAFKAKVKAAKATGKAPAKPAAAKAKTATKAATSPKAAGKVAPAPAKPAAKASASTTRSAAKPAAKTTPAPAKPTPTHAKPAVKAATPTKSAVKAAPAKSATKAAAPPAKPAPKASAKPSTPIKPSPKAPAPVKAAAKVSTKGPAPVKPAPKASVPAKSAAAAVKPKRKTVPIPPPTLKGGSSASARA
ncbi:hypothetical protein EXIGLDRAFT_830622 [Exidia glandulosa HHB12029]|uniref:Ribosomal protein/NADH dehydrogenase domain-containing protein n=1 Tax=Exidia glandulosa HHB12029 TaxID=1314781 RepID=A0A165NH61_EXIGL|nr:hypothetical protein EXIGLDRAFT_830622 [Exidia glandulosa HHB12029]